MKKLPFGPRAMLYTWLTASVVGFSKYFCNLAGRSLLRSYVSSWVLIMPEEQKSFPLDSLFPRSRRLHEKPFLGPEGHHQICHSSEPNTAEYKYFRWNKICQLRKDRKDARRLSSRFTSTVKFCWPSGPLSISMCSIQYQPCRPGLPSLSRLAHLAET